jgi:hypothetical protein
MHTPPVNVLPDEAVNADCCTCRAEVLLQAEDKVSVVM